MSAEDSPLPGKYDVQLVPGNALEQLLALEGLADQFGWGLQPLDSAVDIQTEHRPVPGDRMEFVNDTATTQGSLVRPGQAFEKGWQIRNAGTVDWNDLYLTRLGAYEGDATLNSARRIPTRVTPAGRGLELRVVHHAPTRPGSYICYRVMTAEAGDRLHLGQVRVVDDGNLLQGTQG